MYDFIHPDFELQVVEEGIDLSLLSQIPVSRGVAPWMHDVTDLIPEYDCTDWFLYPNNPTDWGC